MGGFVTTTVAIYESAFSTSGRLIVSSWVRYVCEFNVTLLKTEAYADKRAFFSYFETMKGLAI